MTADVKDNVIKWLGAQSFNNILMLLVLGQISWVGYTIILTTIPSLHKETILHINDILLKAKEEREAILETCEEERNKLSMIYDRWVTLQASKPKDIKSIIADKDNK